jgi:hypothetical protein
MGHDETPPKGATTPPVDGLSNGAGPGHIPGTDPLNPAESIALNQARLAADIQVVRQGIDRIGPAVFVIAYFAAMACLFLAIIARRLAK